MKCIKQQPRSFFDLFKVYTCDDCRSYVNYTYVYIGNQTINIYEFIAECFNQSKQNDFCKLFLKDICLHEEDVYMILDRKELNLAFAILPCFLASNDLYILVLDGKASKNERL